MYIYIIYIYIHTHTQVHGPVGYGFQYHHWALVKNAVEAVEGKVCSVLIIVLGICGVAVPELTLCARWKLRIKYTAA